MNQTVSPDDLERKDKELPEYLSEAADCIGLAIEFESEENWSEVSEIYSELWTLA